MVTSSAIHWWISVSDTYLFRSGNLDHLKVVQDSRDMKRVLIEHMMWRRRWRDESGYYRMTWPADLESSRCHQMLMWMVLCHVMLRLIARDTSQHIPSGWSFYSSCTHLHQTALHLTNVFGLFLEVQ